MDANAFLKSYIEDQSAYNLSKDDEKTIKYQGIQAFILNKLNSSKYRSQKTSSDYEEKVRAKIKLCVTHEKPIHILLPFGAYKNPNIATSPHISFAEVFNIAYLRDYLKPIAKAYKPGVILEYWSVAVFQRKVNRVPVEDTSAYDREFSKLMKFYQKFLPKNLRLEYSRTEDDISRDVIEEQLDMKVQEIRKTWYKQPKDVIDVKLKKAERNVKFPALRLASSVKNKMILESAMYHDAFVSECWAFDHAKWDTKSIITLGHYGTSGWAIRVRSAPLSTVHFWSGIGILYKKSGSYLPTILSSSQYAKIKDSLIAKKIDFMQNVSSNLSNILILDKS